MTPLSAAPRLRPAQDPPLPEAPRSGASKTTLREAAREFEGMLLRQLFQVMRRTVAPSDLLRDSGGARETAYYLFDQAVVTQAMASGTSWGLADRLESAWKAQEGRAQATPKAR